MFTSQPTSAPSVAGAITLSGITVEDAEANKAVLQDAIARVAGVDTEAVTIQSVASARRRLQASVIVDYKIEADDFAAAEEASEKTLRRLAPRRSRGGRRSPMTPVPLPSGRRLKSARHRER